MINGGFQNFLHAITGLPGGFTTTTTMDMHDGWKGPMRKRRKRQRNEKLKKKLHEKYQLPTDVTLRGNFEEEDEEFLHLFFFMED